MRIGIGKLKEVLGMAPFDKKEKEFMKNVVKKCNISEADLIRVAGEVRSEIHKYRHHKLMAEIRRAQIMAGEEAVIKNLKRMGL